MILIKDINQKNCKAEAKIIYILILFLLAI
jgi:hypothetical protein